MTYVQLWWNSPGGRKLTKSLRKIASLTALAILFLTSPLAFNSQASSTPDLSELVGTGRIMVDGAIKNTLIFSLADLTALPKSEVYGALYCGPELVYIGNWGGVLVSSLLEKAGVEPSARAVEFHAQDEYVIKVALPTAYSLTIAYELNGNPLPETLRLVLPSYPGNYWISWILEITVSTSADYDVGSEQYSSNPVTLPSTTPDLMTVPRPTTVPETPSPTQQPTPILPTITPESTPTPQTTQTPSPLQTPNPTQSPVETQTPRPTISPKSTQTPISITPTNTPQTASTTAHPEDQPTTSPNATPLDYQQNQPALSLEPNPPQNYNYPILIALIATGTTAGFIAVKRSRRVLSSNKQQSVKKK